MFANGRGKLCRTPMIFRNVLCPCYLAKVGDTRVIERMFQDVSSSISQPGFTTQYDHWPSHQISVEIHHT